MRVIVISIAPDNSLLRRLGVLHPKKFRFCALLKRIVCCLASARQQLTFLFPRVTKIKFPLTVVLFHEEETLLKPIKSSSTRNFFDLLANSPKLLYKRRSIWILVLEMFNVPTRTLFLQSVVSSVFLAAHDHWYRVFVTLGLCNLM